MPGSEAPEPVLITSKDLEELGFFSCKKRKAATLSQALVLDVALHGDQGPCLPRACLLQAGVERGSQRGIVEGLWMNGCNGGLQPQVGLG